MVHQELPVLRPARRVLVIDDEPSFCRFMSRLVSGLGYNVTTTCQAKCAYLDELTEQDIVFLDMMMPEMDGAQVLGVLSDHQIKASIVLMSGGDYALAKAETMAKRADLRLIGVLHKPFRQGDLRTILEAD